MSERFIYIYKIIYILHPFPPYCFLNYHFRNNLHKLHQQCHFWHWPIRSWIKILYQNHLQIVVYVLFQILCFHRYALYVFCMPILLLTSKISSQFICTFILVKSILPQKSSNVNEISPCYYNLILHK